MKQCASSFNRAARFHVGIRNDNAFRETTPFMNALAANMNYLKPLHDSSIPFLQHGIKLIRAKISGFEGEGCCGAPELEPFAKLVSALVSTSSYCQII